MTSMSQYKKLPKRLSKKRGLKLCKELMREFARGNVYEAPLNHPTIHLYGLQQGDDVFIDPRTCVVSVLLHELLHRLKPHWSEHKVDREAKNVLSCMGEKEKTEWWLAYEIVKRHHATVKVSKIKER